MDEHTLNDLLECSVCLERLETSSKVLPCQHTFCRKCLEVIVSSRQELRCPECRILVDVKIEELPPNVLLMRILEGMKNAAVAKIQQQISTPLNAAQEQILGQQNIELKQQKQLVQYKLQHKSHPVATHSQSQQQSQPWQHVQQHQHQHNQQQQQQFQRRCILPHAYALYNFDSSEANDLHFKKGDLILLKRKIDINWYVGQLNGKEGTFPINYVQIIVPLPAPQCIALYDFKMGPNEEEGCLSFKKGTFINVLRRVDHNWAEGRIGSTIGIFPIAFVELNALAKQILESCMPAAGQTVLSCGQQNATHQPHQPHQQSRKLPPIPLLDPTSNTQTSSSDGNSSSSAFSSQTTSPDSHTTSSSSTSNSATSSADNTNVSSPNRSCPISLPSSPQQSFNTTVTSQHIAPIGSSSASVRYRGKEKRHSLNALLSTGGGPPTLSVLQSNRHSAEILSAPNELTVSAPTACNDSFSMQRPRSSGSDAALLSPFEVGTSTVTGQSTPAITANTGEQQSQQSHQASAARINVLKTGAQQHVPPTLPWGYLALYPYKPRKNDELELKKGCVYIVTERCLDGWFKGKNWQDFAGVFPGNYVTPLRNRDQQQFMHQLKLVPAHIASNTVHKSNNNNNIDRTQNINNRSDNMSPPQQLPEIPPRQADVADVGHHIDAPTPTPTCVSSVWTKPLSHSVEAFFNRHKDESLDKVHSKQKDIAASAIVSPTSNSIATSTSISLSSTSTSSAAVSLMKRLAHIKSRSKSPNDSNSAAILPLTKQQQQSTNTTYAHENFQPEDMATQLLHPVHVRSGSCPSQLLQSLPMDLNVSITGASSNQHPHPQLQQNLPAQITSILNNNGGSQRVRSFKERPQLLQNVRHANDTNIHAPYNISQLQQQQLQQQQQQRITANITNVLFNKCAQQQKHMQNSTESAGGGIHHRKSQSLDANTLMTTAPISSSTVLTTVASTTAAITASATTKSTQGSSRESRFRCVVPYPPNSDIELELHVGDIIYVQRKQKNGWYKGTHGRTQKTGLFPASFVEPDI